MTTNSGEIAANSEAEKFLRAARFADFKVQMMLLLESLGMSDEPSASYPVWVRRCAEKVNRASFPKLYSLAEPSEVKPPYAMGIVYGMMVTGQKVASAVIPAGMPEPTEEQRDTFWKFLYGDDCSQFTPSPDGDVIAVEIHSEVAARQKDFGPAEQVAFDQGKADAGQMILGDNNANEATRIYSLMLTFWRVVDVLPTSQSLFELLTRALGANIVGSDPKRVQQLCRRIGKRFGKPGRPKKLLLPASPAK